MKAYLHCEGVDLDCKNVAQNKGLRMIAKAIFNHLWGKFVQNEKDFHIQYVKSYDELLSITKDLRYQSTSFDFVSEECLRVATTLKHENNQHLTMGNVIIASFVISYARLKLFTALQKIGSIVFYYDMDSIICSWGS